MEKKIFRVVYFPAHFFSDFMEFPYKCEKDVAPSFVDSSLAQIGVEWNKHLFLQRLLGKSQLAINVNEIFSVAI